MGGACGSLRRPKENFRSLELITAVVSILMWMIEEIIKAPGRATALLNSEASLQPTHEHFMTTLRTKILTVWKET